MSSHTEGTWEVVELSTGKVAVVASGTDLSICKLGQRREIALANGRLIAAAPDLLAVAEALLRYHGVTLDEPRQPLAEIADMACNAVIKATGGQS